MSFSVGILDTVGDTPLIGLDRLVRDPKVRVVAKWEGANPSGSIKIRPALYIVRAAEKLGLLRPGSTIIESTSGNFGVAPARCAATG